MPARMQWSRLLSTRRLGADAPRSGPDVRSEFQRDADRITFSSAFRRLQDKTQVHPLAELDYVRTRLTHSLEVAAVGRSLGTLAGAVVREFEASEPASPAEFGNVVAAACLAHDIGNPPFGHPGEDAIRDWFLGPGAAHLGGLAAAEAAEFTRFEGNAQGFRVLARLQHPQNRGGLQLTCATLATFAKYPRGTAAAPAPGHISAKKFGFFASEEALFAEVAAETGLVEGGPQAWQRHPLVFLMEAADDICYHVIDLEDAHRVGQIAFGDAEALLAPIASGGGGQPLGASYARLQDEKSRLEYLRARAINELVDAACEAFRDHYDALLAGTLGHDLVSLCRHRRELAAIYEFAMSHIYRSRPVIEAHATGSEVMPALLSRAVDAVAGRIAPGDGPAWQQLAAAGAREPSQYGRLHLATDFVAGMTDSYAVMLHARAQNRAAVPATGSRPALD